MEFHKFVQAMDMEAINIVGKDGETPLLILEMIAIQNWMHLLEISNTKCQKGINRLKETYVALYAMLENDAK